MLGPMTLAVPWAPGQAHNCRPAPIRLPFSGHCGQLGVGGDSVTRCGEPVLDVRWRCEATALIDWFRLAPVPIGLAWKTDDPDPVQRASQGRHPDQTGQNLLSASSGTSAGRRHVPAGLRRLDSDHALRHPEPPPLDVVSLGVDLVHPDARSRPPVLAARRDGNWLGGLECRVAGRCQLDASSATSSASPGPGGRTSGAEDLVRYPEVRGGCGLFSGARRGRGRSRRRGIPCYQIR